MFSSVYKTNCAYIDGNEFCYCQIHEVKREVVKRVSEFGWAHTSVDSSRECPCQLPEDNLTLCQLGILVRGNSFIPDNLPSLRVRQLLPQ